MPGTPPRIERLRPLLLWGLTDARLDLAVTAAVVVALAVSRFALLASGPWEWDETLFARGMLHFELAAHFPQPPGFPGFLALGWLFMPLASEPYRALQLLSALTSVLSLWPLAALGRRVAKPEVAAAAALLVLLLPGPWLFSVRGFSSTAAAFFLFAAAALAAGGLEGRRATVFTVLLTTAFLVRPILLPTVGLLWLVGIARVPPRRLLPGVALGCALISVAIAVMAHLEGGWAAFLRPFVVHADFHAARLHRNTHDLAEVGLLTGVGGLAPATALLLASVAGLWAWGRRTSRRTTLAWAAILALTVAQLLWLQNRSYARYAVPVQMGVAPLVAGTAGLLPPPLAVAGLLGAAGVAAWHAFPLVLEQHRETFGAWQATIDAARIAADRGWAVVVEPEVHVFSSYWWHVLEWRGEPVPPMVLSPRAPEPWIGVDRPWVVATVHPHLYLPSLTGRTTTYGEVSESLRPLTQRRFLSAEVIENPPLPVGQWWTREQLPDGAPFMWAGPGAELWLPPSPAATRIGLRLRPMPGEAPLEVTLADSDERITLPGDSGATWCWLRSETSPGPLVVRLHRAASYPPGGGDERPLATQLFDVVVRPPGVPFEGGVVPDRALGRLRLEVDGRHPAEHFGVAGLGFWLTPSSHLRLGLDEPGTLELQVSAPRPEPAEVTIAVGGRRVIDGASVGPEPTTISVPLSGADLSAGTVELELSSTPFIPAEAGLGDDRRELGVVLHHVRFAPAVPGGPGWWSTGETAAGASIPSPAS